MRMRETWLAISPAKKTVLFSAALGPIPLPPRQTVYSGLLTLKVGSQKDSESDDVWFAVSEEDMTPPR